VTGTGQRHFEPFIHLVDVTHASALVAWGGFFFEERSDGWLVVDDDALEAGRRRDGGSIGVASAPYGRGVVEVLDADDKVVASAATDERNHVWVEGLEPDTAYRYRVRVDDEPWADGERWDWVLDDPDDGGPGRPRPAGRRYDLRLRTHPAPHDSEPVTFLAMGDYGVGITNGEAGRRQHDVSRTMEHLDAGNPVRFIVSLGDNIYAGKDDKLEQSGDEDDDWYFTFYEPYRYLIDHLPVYPAAGNHDSSDGEANDDRAQLADNFHLDSRFRAAVDEGRASLDPGLFYRVGVGALLELVCVDTSSDGEDGHFFEDDDHRAWLEETFAPGRFDGTWLLPFGHHPAYCAGPDHDGLAELLEQVVPLYQRAGVRLVLSGHEHNFQHGHVDGIDHVISGGAGKLDERTPTKWRRAGTRSWASAAHCLLVEADGQQLVLTPYGPATGDEDEPMPLAVATPDGAPADARLVIPATSS